MFAVTSTWCAENINCIRRDTQLNILAFVLLYYWSKHIDYIIIIIVYFITPDTTQLWIGYRIGLCTYWIFQQRINLGPIFIVLVNWDVVNEALQSLSVLELPEALQTYIKHTHLCWQLETQLHVIHLHKILFENLYISSNGVWILVVNHTTKKTCNEYECAGICCRASYNLI